MLFELIGAVIESLALDEGFLELKESLLLFLLSHFELGFVDLYLPLELLVLSSEVVLNTLVRNCDFTDGELTVLVFADVREAPHAFEFMAYIRTLPAFF